MSDRPTVLVTGAGRGIGRAVVEAFADEGWQVVAGVRDVPAAEAAHAARPQVRVVRLDVTDAGSVRAAVARAEELAGGALSCLVSNAGYAVLGAVEDVDLEEVRLMFETNFIGAATVVQAALPAMREAGDGSLVFVSSIGARLVNPLLGMYHASKYAASAMAEALAVEVGPFGLRVATVEPGMVDTDFPRATRPTGSVARGEGPYLPLLAGVRAGFGEWRRRFPTSAATVAEAVVAAALDPDPPFRTPVGDDARHLAGLLDGTADDRARQQEHARFLGLEWPLRGPAAVP